MITYFPLAEEELISPNFLNDLIKVLCLLRELFVKQMYNPQPPNEKIQFSRMRSQNCFAQNISSTFLSRDNLLEHKTQSVD